MKIFKYLSNAFKFSHQGFIVVITLMAIIYAFLIVFDASPIHQITLKTQEFISIKIDSSNKASKWSDTQMLSSNLEVVFKEVPVIKFKKFSALTLNQKLILGLLAILVALSAFIYLRIFKFAEVFFLKIFKKEIFSNAQVSMLKYISKMIIYLWIIDFLIEILYILLIKFLVSGSSHYLYKPLYFDNTLVDSLLYCLIAGIFYAFAKIFEYGMELQQDHDLNI